MKLLLVKLNRFLIESPVTLANISNKVDIILKYSYLIKSCIDEHLVEKAFYTAFEEVINYCTLANRNNKYTITLYKLYIAANQYGNSYWLTQIKNLLPSTTENSSCWRKLTFILINKEEITWRDYVNDSLTGDEKKFLFAGITNIAGFKI